MSGAGFTREELKEACRALYSTLGKCEKIGMDKLGQPQRTLLKRRIRALEVALALIRKEQTQLETKEKARTARVYGMAFARVYPLLVQKAEKKGRTREEVDEIIRWLTGYDEAGLQARIDEGASLEAFYAQAPRINPNAHKITGAVCGVRVENIEDPLMQKIRWLDKLVDELAKGKAMEKVLRQ